MKHTNADKLFTGVLRGIRFRHISGKSRILRGKVATTQPLQNPSGGFCSLEVRK